jgi:hypothetical protein
MKRLAWGVLLVPFLMASSCGDSDDRQSQQQEAILNEGTSQVGMPAIKNFRERRELRQIYEMRDQSNFTTYTYLENLTPTVVHGYTSMGGKFTFLGVSIGYPIPYSTQFTSPLKKGFENYAMPQADPNGLFSPASADGTWVLLFDSESRSAKPAYVEPKVATFTFKLPVDP